MEFRENPQKRVAECEIFTSALTSLKEAIDLTTDLAETIRNMVRDKSDSEELQDDVDNVDFVEDQFQFTDDHRNNTNISSSTSEQVNSDPLLLLSSKQSQNHSISQYHMNGNSHHQNLPPQHQKNTTSPSHNDSHLPSFIEPPPPL